MEYTASDMDSGIVLILSSMQADEQKTAAQAAVFVFGKDKILMQSLNIGKACAILKYI